ncbi:uncharacterized protein LOC124405415 isoform X2 [Diprion similis]|uniref:uncharacterized protein LOC124405415 isoform X2 n=1 Tax=Diprion similis TaxID=362088 RepID=UPI001EF85B42|nr:uncharacterized protein LOC124405415 isoform X2 [Diprion similis]
MEAELANTTSGGIPWNDDEITWSPTNPPFTPEEEDAMVSIIVIVIGVIIAVIGLFSMGIFIDCRHQKSDSAKRRRPLRLKMPPVGRRRGDRRLKNEDDRSIATDMCTNGTSDPGPHDFVNIV